MNDARPASDDLRVCFVGDSFVAGVGDPEHRGWVGRLAARTHRSGRPLTVYNLGVRRDTSTDVRNRLPSEALARRAVGGDCRLVVSFGVNDTTAEAAGIRVDAQRSVANLRAVADVAAAQGWPVLVLGPPPLPDPDQNTRIARLNTMFRASSGSLGLTFVDVFDALAADPVWMREVHTGDGAHPAAEGYQRLADLVFPAWWGWISATDRVTGSDVYELDRDGNGVGCD